MRRQLVPLQEELSAVMVLVLLALFYGGSVVGLSAAGSTSGRADAGVVIGGGIVAGIAVLSAPAVR